MMTVHGLRPKTGHSREISASEGMVYRIPDRPSTGPDRRGTFRTSMASGIASAIANTTAPTVRKMCSLPAATSSSQLFWT